MNERKLKQLDLLFGGESPASQGEQVELVDDSLIDEFPGHPYRLYIGKRHNDLLESIKELGVISYLSEDMQFFVHRLITEKRYKLDIEKADLLKGKFKTGELTETLADGILSGKAFQAKAPTKIKEVKIKSATIKKYFVKGESAKEIQSTITAALEFYFATRANIEKQGGMAE